MRAHGDTFEGFTKATLSLGWMILKSLQYAWGFWNPKTTLCLLWACFWIFSAMVSSQVKSSTRLWMIWRLQAQINQILTWQKQFVLSWNVLTPWELTIGSGVRAGFLIRLNIGRGIGECHVSVNMYLVILKNHIYRWGWIKGHAMTSEIFLV